MSGTTPRLHLPYPGLGDGPDGADVPYWAQLLASALDNAAIDDQGILSSRPTAGIKGRYFFVIGDGTPANNGILWRDNGTTWAAIGTVSPASVGTTELQDNAVTLAKMADDSVGAAEIIALAVGTGELADKAVTTGKIADALKPSAGAGGATESLRALGTAAGTAAAGNDARLSDTRTPTDNTVSTAKIVAGAVTQAKLALKYDAGRGVFPGSADTFVTFATVFTAPPSVVTTTERQGGDPGNDADNARISGVTAAGFYMENRTGGDRTYHWVAIGV